MIWWSYSKKMEKGVSAWKVRWYLIQRGLFLVLLQLTWVNASWGGFKQFQPGHFGIIACIGASMILLAFIVHFKWYVQLLIALAILTIHPLLLTIPYNVENTWERVWMQIFIDAGDYNKYPVLPWFTQAILGSVMASGWLGAWKTDKKRITMGLSIGAVAVLFSVLIRMARDYGNIFPFSEIGSFSFYFDQKYPPSLYHSLWFFGMVVIVVTGFIAIGRKGDKLLSVFTIPGRVALFFYAMHIAILGVFIKRFDLYYREGNVYDSLIGVALMMVIMIPLCMWFYRVKQRSTNYFIRMI
jgi:uncharacterized membrane protein